MTTSPRGISPDVLTIELAPVTISAFGSRNGHGYWLASDTVIADGIRALTVTPVIRSDKQGTFADIDCVFDPDAFPLDRFGLVYGDTEFEANIDLHIRDVLGLPAHLSGVSYTEMGMQSDTIVSMEAGRDWCDWFLAGITGHELYRIGRDPRITRLAVPSRGIDIDRAFPTEPRAGSRDHG